MDIKNATDHMNFTCYGLVVDPRTLPDPDEPVLAEAVPKLVIQIALSMASNMGFALALEPLHLPRIVPDMLGGFVLSPVVLDAIHPGLGRKLWPTDKMSGAKGIANLGLLFAMFIAGINARVPPISQLGKRTAFLAFLATFMPMVIGSAIISPLIKTFGSHDAPKAMFYWAGVISGSSFVSVIPCLRRLKLVYSNLGREALAVGMCNEMWSWSWILLAVVSSSRSIYGLPFVCAFTIFFTVFCFVAVVPAVGWIRVTMADERGGDLVFGPAVVNAVFLAVLACGIMSEMLGAYSLFGAFTLGLAMPPDLLSMTVVEKMEDCVTGVLTPLYFSLCGTHLDFLHLTQRPLFWGTVIVPFLAKIASSLLAPLLVKIAFRDAIGLGLVTTTKGLLSIIMITIGLDRGHLPVNAFTEIWLSILASSILVPPLMSLLYRKGTNATVPYVHRAVQGLKPVDDLRILANVHTPRDVPGIINLLEITDIAPSCPLSLFALRTVELVGPGNSMFIFHDSGESSEESSYTTWTSVGSNPLLSRRGAPQADERVINAFTAYASEHSAATNLRSMTIVCPTDAMHEEICNAAEYHRAALLILPYHKHQAMDGRLEDSNPEFAAVNQTTVEAAPCSVGIFVDKGFGSLPLGGSGESTPDGSAHSSRVQAEGNSGQRGIKLGMIYMGGPDDREALTLAWRLAAHPNVELTVIRFVVGDHPVDVEPIMDFFADEGVDEPLTLLTESEKEKGLDAEFIESFLRITNDDVAITYTEKVSNSGEDTVGVLRGMEHSFDLYIVGRGSSVLSPLTVGLAEWSDSPELGAVGDVIVNSDFCSHVSVLVVQQYTSARSGGGSK